MSEAERAIERLTQLHETLSADFHAALKALVETDSQYARRTVVRTLFAHIEGALYGMKCVALGREVDTPGLFSPAEEALLREEAYDLSDAGHARARPARLAYLSNFRFAFSCFARAFDTTYRPEYEGTGWQAMRIAADIRHRITHPKSPESLSISDGEVDVLRTASLWFIEIRNRLFAQAGESGSSPEAA